MSQVPKWVQRAMNTAIRKVRFESASIRLPGTPFPGDDTEVIREATRLYVETWVIPLMEAVRDGKKDIAECLY